MTSALDIYGLDFQNVHHFFPGKLALTSFNQCIIHPLIICLIPSKPRLVLTPQWWQSFGSNARWKWPAKTCNFVLDNTCQDNYHAREGRCTNFGLTGQAEISKINLASCFAFGLFTAWLCQRSFKLIIRLQVMLWDGLYIVRFSIIKLEIETGLTSGM